MRRCLAAFMMIVAAAAVDGRAEFSIHGARIAEGDLWVVGQVNEPDVAVTLDDSFTERTDSRGRFRFRLRLSSGTLHSRVKDCDSIPCRCDWELWSARSAGSTGRAWPPWSPGSRKSARRFGDRNN